MKRDHALAPGTLTDVGLILPANLPYEKWALIGPAIARSRRVMTWALGDWVLWGESQYGEKYAQAVEATGYEIPTLVTIAAVCERIPPKLRRKELSFEHHKVVAYLPELTERVKMLDWAVEHGITREQLRDRVGRKTPRTVEGKSAGKMRCPKCAYEWTL